MKKIFLALIAFCLLLSTPCLAGEWNQTGSCNQSSSKFSTENFGNGKTLKSGGFYASGPSYFCEIYDPITGEWEPTDPMHYSRTGEDFLIKISDTEILATGQGGSNYTSEIYNLITEEWTITGNMHFWHEDHSTEAFENTSGDTLFMVIGGDAVNDYKGCEVYDPATGEWTITGFLPSGKRLSPSVVLPNGDIMSCGGGITTYDQCAIYNHITRVWEEIAPLNQGHVDATIELDNGNPMIIAGSCGNIFLNSCEIYDFATQEWAFTDSLEISRTGHCSKTLLNTKTIAICGLPGWANMSCELYDHTTNQWETAASTYYPYYNFSPEILFDERVLAIGKYHCEVYAWNHQPVVSQLENLGLNEATIGETLSFSVIASDPDNDSVSVRVDWDDGQTSPWSDLVPSGTVLQFSHSWSQSGNYQLSAQGRDQWHILNENCHNSLSEWTDPILIIVTGTGVEPDPQSPEPIVSIYPNPFRNSTKISFSNSAQVRPGQAEISIFNIKGQVIKTWSLNQTTSWVVWNGKDANGKELANGIYLCKLTVGDFSAMQKIILLE